MFKDSFLEERVQTLGKEFREYEAIGKQLGTGRPYLRETQEITNSPWAIVEGRRRLILSSYSYLGLLGDPRIKVAVNNAMDKYGTGTHGVRLLTGTLAIHNELERQIAEFKQADNAAVFSSGYSANLAIFSCLLNKDDIVVCDRFAHQSIVDGVKLSGAQLVYFQHNNMNSLEEALQENEGKNVIVAVDGVYSMDGDLANLPQIIPLCKKYHTPLMVDEAHSIGNIGKTGRGVEEHFGLAPDDIDIKMGTISKAIPSTGGYVAGKEDLIFTLKRRSKAFLFSAPPSPLAMAAASESLKIIRSEPERIEKLHRNTARYKRELNSMGYNTLKTETSIIPIIVEKDTAKAELLSLKCFDKDVFATVVKYPAVPKDLPRLRTVATAAFSEDDLTFALEVLQNVGKSMKLI